MYSPLDSVRVYEFSKISEPRGNLSFIEEGRHVPFPIKRVFYIYDIPGGETRGGHANKANTEMVIAVSGCVDLRLYDGRHEKTITLNRANKGVLIPPGTWVVMDNFVTGTVLLALCSTEFDENDYIRDIDQYLKYAKEAR